MRAQAVLPIYPPAAGIAGWASPAGSAPGSAAPALDFRPARGTGAVERCRHPGQPFDWTVNPYRGCEFGCFYCYAREGHQAGTWRRAGGTRRIRVEHGAGAALERLLARRDLAGRSIAIGTATDPYQDAESRFRVTRSVLEVLAGAAGISISISTKSPLVLRDLELLDRLDRKHALTVNVALTTLDAKLAARLEPRAPRPAERMRAVGRLAEAGIATAVCVMPVMPAINDGEEILRPLLAAARERGAFQVVASPLFLRPATRRGFLAWLRREFPAEAERYARLYRRRDRLAPADRDRLLATFRRLRLEYGFPRPTPEGR